MEQNFKKIFKIGLKESRTDLSNTIWFNIIEKETESLRVRRWVYVSLGFLSLTGFILMIKNVIVQFIQTGFYKYLSLAFSDSSYISSHFKDFILTLTDSLPTTSLMLSFFLLFIFFISIRKILIQSDKRLLGA